MDKVATLLDRIHGQREGVERTQALWELLATLDDSANQPIPDAAFAALREIQTDDEVQAALIGIVLSRQDRDASDLGILARVFFGLSMNWEPQVQEAARLVFGGRSPKAVFEDITEMVGNQAASEADLFYGFNVIGKFDYDSLQ